MHDIIQSKTLAPTHALWLGRGQLEELTLKSSATTELKILFEEPWMMQTSHARLRGDVPLDREAGSLSVVAGKSLSMLVGQRLPKCGSG